jgi:hypothetical protein
VRRRIPVQSFAIVLVGCALGFAACGRATTSSTASSTPSSSPIASSPTPGPTTGPYTLGPGSCVAPASGTPSQPLGHDNVVVDIPPGWTQVSTGSSETVVLQISAPPSYANQPTSIKVQTFIGNYYGQTAHSVAVTWASQHPFADTNSVTDCAVASGDAAFVRYAGSGVVGYQFFMVRVDPQYQGLARLWGLNLEGTAGLDSNSAADAMRVLGSWKWGG